MTLPIIDHRLAPTPRDRADALRDLESATEIISRIAPFTEPAHESDPERLASVEAAEAAESDDERSGSAHGTLRTRTGRRTGRHKLPSGPARAGGSARPGGRPSGRPSGRSMVRRVVMTASAALLAIVAIAG